MHFFQQIFLSGRDIFTLVAYICVVVSTKNLSTPIQFDKLMFTEAARILVPGTCHKRQWMARLFLFFCWWYILEIQQNALARSAEQVVHIQCPYHPSSEHNEDSLAICSVLMTSTWVPSAEPSLASTASTNRATKGRNFHHLHSTCFTNEVLPRI